MTTQLQKMAELDLKKLLTETSHVLEVDDFADIAKLNELAEKVSDPNSPDNSAVVALPRAVGNQVLYPLTIGRAIWFEENALPWFSDDGVFLDLVLGYILSKHVSIEDLALIVTKEKCISLVRSWWKKSDATYDELISAMADLLPKKNQDNLPRCDKCNAVMPKENDDEKTYGPLIMLLCREYGGTPCYWIWEESLVVSDNLIASYISQQTLEYEQMRRNAGKAGSSLPVARPKMQAIKNYRDQFNLMRAKWQTKI